MTHGREDPWLEDEAAPPELRALLATARTDGPSAAELERLAQRLSPLVGVKAALLLPTTPLPPIAPEALTAAQGAGAVKLAGVAAKKLAWSTALKLVGAACVIGVGALSLSARPAPAASAPAEATAQVSVAKARVPVSHAVEAPPPSVELARTPPSLTPPESERRERVAVARATPPKPALVHVPSELELMQRAQAPGMAPAQVLSVLRDHERRYPSGMFAQEREVLAISALLELGRRSEAETRAHELARAFPGSLHLRRVRVLLDQGPAQ